MKNEPQATAQEKAGFARLSNAESATLLEELYYLLHAGIRTADAFAILAEDETNPLYKKLFLSMSEASDNGTELKDVFAQAGCFPDYVPLMLGIGERAGRTEETVRALAESCEARATLDRRLRSALVYPALLLVIMLAVIGILLIYVLPIFNDVYAQLGGSLTGLAGALMSFGKVLSAISPVLIVLLAALVLFIVVFATSTRFRMRVLSRWEKRHGDRGLAAKIATGRFAQALSLCMSSGLNLEESLEMASGLLHLSEGTQAKVAECSAQLANGASLTQALGSCGLLPARECRLLEAGQKGGAAEEAMDDIAQRMTAVADQALEDSVSRVEPAIVTVTSIMVGIMLLAVMLPLVNIMSAIG